MTCSSCYQPTFYTVDSTNCLHPEACFIYTVCSYLIYLQQVVLVLSKGDLDKNNVTTLRDLNSLKKQTMNNSCNHSNGTEGATHVIQAQPVPEKYSEANRKESSELHDPGPQLGADDHHEQNTQLDLEQKQKELSIYLV